MNDYRHVAIPMPELSTVVNGVRISRTFVKGKGVNKHYFAADTAIFDVRWLGITDDEWDALILKLGWQNAIRHAIGKRTMVEWLQVHKDFLFA